jgi:DNA-binding MarR family transcriptional regulator
VAERRPDPADRRRVLVGVAKGAERIAALYGSLERDARRVLDGRSSEELETISTFLRDMHAVGVEHVARLSRG